LVRELRTGGPLVRALYLVLVWLHILAAAAWAGGMLFLASVLIPALRSPALRDRAPAAIGAVGEQFRRVGWATLVTLLATGTLLAATRAGSLGTLTDAGWWSSPFGRVLALKLVVVGLVLALAVVHDFHVGPRAGELMSSEPGSERALAWRAAARWMGRLNLLLTLVILAFAVLLVRGMP
jgi:putative copper resistance protein D